MHSLRLGVDLRLQRVGIGRFQLRQLPPVEHQLGHRHAFAREPLQLGDIGRILATFSLAPALQTQPVEQHRAQLLRRSDRERTLGGLVHLPLQLGDLGRESARQFGQIIAIDLDPATLHPPHGRDQWPVNHLIDSAHPLGGDARLEPLPQAQADVGILGGIFGRRVQWHLVEGDLLLADPAHRFESNAFMLEMGLRQLVESMSRPSGVEVEAHHQRIVVGG